MKSANENERIVIYDVETTGLNANAGDRVVEAAFVVYQDGTPVERFSTLINPGRPIPKEVIRLHGIDARRVRNAPSFAEALPAITALLKAPYHGGYNIGFDKHFMLCEFERAGAVFPYPRGDIDVLEAVRAARPDLSHYSLAHACTALGIWRGNAHRALPDTEHTGALLFKLLSLLPVSLDISGLHQYLKSRTVRERKRDRATAAVIQQALAAGQDLRIQYLKKGEPLISERTITPERVIVMGRHYYLIAFCHLRQARRRFKISRIKKARPV